MNLKARGFYFDTAHELFQEELQKMNAEAANDDARSVKSISVVSAIRGTVGPRPGSGRGSENGGATAAANINLYTCTSGSRA